MSNQHLIHPTQFRPGRPSLATRAAFFILLGSLGASILAIAISLPGCACPERVTLKAVKSALEVVGEEYLRYIEADPRLDAADRVTRTRTLGLIHQAILETEKTR